MNRRRRRRLAVGLALAGVGFAASYGYAPGLVPASIRRWVETVNGRLDPGLALLIVGAATGVLGLLYAWITQRNDATPLPAQADGEPGQHPAVAGQDLTAHYERTVAGDTSGTGTEPLRDRLRGVVIEAYRHEREAEGAATVVDEGAWTDDRYAAAFLSTTAAVDYPLSHRLYAWLYPERAYERRVARTLRAVERTCGERVTGYEPPGRPADGWWRRLRAAVEGSS